MFKSFDKTAFLSFMLFLSIIIFAAGCSILNRQDPAAEDPINSISSEAEAEATLAPLSDGEEKIADEPVSTEAVQSEAETISETSEPTPESYTIRLWVPPQFDMGQNTKAGNALSSVISEYTEAHPNINISVRIKAVSGDSSMLNTITAANHIAQDVLPSLALISRSDMEIAVQRGLIQPIITSVFSDSNSWYPYARQSAVIDGNIYGIPVFGDSLVLTYRTAKVGAEFTDWHDILSRGLPIGFAPSSSASQFATFIYLSKGGKLTNDQGQPYLDQQLLTETLDFFLTGGKNGAFPPSLAQLTDQSQVWQRFNDGTYSIIASSFSSFNHYRNDQISVYSLPIQNEAAGYPLMNSWNLVMMERNPMLQKEALNFAEYLSDILVNDELSEAAGYLPIRNSEHTQWKNNSQYNMVLSMSEKGILAPVNQISNKIMPVINNAVTQVIKNQLVPETAAQDAISALN